MTVDPLAIVDRPIGVEFIRDISLASLQLAAVLDMIREGADHPPSVGDALGGAARMAREISDDLDALIG